MHKAHKLRIYPDWKQRSELKHQFGCNRYVYNAFIDVNQNYYDKGIYLSHFDMCKILTKMKDPNLSWLHRANAQSLQNTLKNFSMAIKGLAEGTSGYPRRKSKYGQQSIQYPQRVKIKGDRIKFPKVGWIYFRDDRTIEGKIKTVTLKKTVAGEYYASVLFETGEKYPQPERKIEESDILGVDLGITNFAVTSNGDVYENPRHFVRNQANLKRKQKDFARKKRGSNNWIKAKLQVAKCYRKSTNAWNDYQHKLSSDMVKNNHAIIVEDLNVEGMVKNHKLAKHIQDARWVKFQSYLEYKCKWSGKHFVKVDRFYPSSKTCNECGTINKMLSLGDREWQCQDCGAIHNRDFNAALNLQRQGILKLKTEGYSVSACGGSIIPDRVHAGYRVGPLKQEVPASLH